MDVVLWKILFPEEGFGEEIHVAIVSGKTLADCSQIIYIYIYIYKLNFLGSLFWTYFGEVLERFWREILDNKRLGNRVFYVVSYGPCLGNHLFYVVS